MRVKSSRASPAPLVVAMPRKKLIRSDFLPYHVTARVNNREPFPIPLPQVWEILSKECLFRTLLGTLEFHAVTLMKNHLHMLLTTPFGDLGEAMRDFFGSVNRTILEKAGRTGRLFGSSYHQTLIDSGHYYSNVMKYVYRNPVKAGYCERVEDYEFSTIHGLVGLSQLPFPLFHPKCGYGINDSPEDPLRLLEWLNKPHSKEAQEAIQKALLRQKFGLAPERVSRKPVQLEIIEL